MGIFSDVASFISDNSDAISTGIQAASTLFSNSEQEESQEEALSQYRQGAQQAAESLTKAEQAALEETLGSLDTQRQISEQKLSELESTYGDIASQFDNRITGAAEDFSTKVDQVGDTYANTLDTAADEFGQTAQNVAGNYAGRLDTAADEFGQQTKEVANEYSGKLRDISNRFAGRMDEAAQQYQPYAEAGKESLAELQRIAASDPGTLRPEQRDQREDFLRDARANLAASNLRGAGRAGTAAVMEGLSDLHAKFYDQNEQRNDWALRQLSDMGYNATGQQAGIGQEVARTGMELSREGAGTVAEAGQTAAQTDYQADTQGAQARMDAGMTAAETAYKADAQGAQMQAETGLSGANQMFAAQDAAARMSAEQAGNEAAATENYYNSLSGIAASEGQARAGSERRVGGYKAAAESNPAFMAAQGEIASGQREGQTFGRLSNIFANFGKEMASQDRKDAPTAVSNPKPQYPAISF